MYEKVFQENARLFDLAKSKRTPHESYIRDAYFYTDPDRMFGKRGQVEGLTHIYDSTASRGVRNLVTNIMKLLIPQSQPWAEVVYRNDEIKRRLETSLALPLAQANQRLFNHFSDSNFYLATQEALYDVAIAGTMCVMFVDVEGEPLGYLAVPMDQMYFLENHDEQIDVVFRQHKMEARQLVSRFGNDGLSSRIKDRAKESPTDEIEIRESIVPYGSGFLYCITEGEGGDKLTDPVQTPWNPFVISRWEKSLGSVWGNSPVRQAVPAINAANKIQRDILKFGEYAANGLWQTTDETFNAESLKGRMKPGSVIAVSESLQPVGFPGQFLLNYDILRSIQSDIKSMLFDSTPPSEENLKYMREEAVLLLRNEFLAQVGEPAQRLQREYLTPIATQAAARLQARGDIIVITPDQFSAMGLPGFRQSDVFKVSVNAALQRALAGQEAQQIVQALAVTRQTMGDAQVAAHVDLDKLSRDLLGKLGLPSVYLRTPREAKQIKANMDQQQQAIAALGEMLGSSGQNLSKIVGSGNDGSA